jgi:hypothetical protein
MSTQTIDSTKGNGTTAANATAEFNSKIDLALDPDSSGSNSERGGVVLVPRGVYKVGAISLPAPDEGWDGGNLILRGEPRATLLGTSGTKMFDLSNRSKITFENIDFDFNGSEDAGSYIIYGASNEA